MPLRLAIMGRPNVGKSTLFNRLAGSRLAIVDDQPGVTRDRREAPGQLAGLPLLLIDTAGFEDVRDGSLEARMRAQTEAALDTAEAVLFLIDARDGVVPEDETFAQILRRSGLPVILAANKAEGRAGEGGVLEAYGLGLGEPVGLSAQHGEGFGDLYEAIRQAIGEARHDELLAEDQERETDERAEALLDALSGIDIEDESLAGEKLIDAIEEAEASLPPPEDDSGQDEGAPPRPIRLALIGRPNAGKSTLLNTLLGSDRVLTGPEAGITRDSIEVAWEWDGRRIQLIDTAGLRRKAKVQEKLEQLSTADTIRSLKFADVVGLVMDADQALEKQDLQIADLVLREGRALVLVVSKWDAVENKSALAKAIRERANRLLPNAGEAPVVFLSGLTGRHADKLMPAVAGIYDNWTARVKTGDLNRWLRYTMERHPAPAVHGKRIKPRYMAQIKARPPTFVLMASRGRHMPEQYKRFLVNGMREAFGMTGVPIRLLVRQPANPFADKPRRRKK